MPVKIYSVTTFLLLVTIMTWCNACAPSRHLADFEVANTEPDSYTVVPLTVDSRQPVIPVTIEGIEIPLALDSGGFEEIALSPTALENLNVKYTGTHVWRVGVHGLLAPSRAKAFIIPDMNIGNMQLINVSGHEFHFSDLRLAEKTPPALKNGIIGLALLGRFKMIIDYRAGVLVLSTDGQYPPQYQPETWPSCKIDLSDLNVGIQGTLTADGQKLSCVWDTGASHSIIRPGIADPTKLIQRKHYTTASYSNLLLDSHDCGPFEFAEFDFRQPPVDAIIGYNFFKDHTVCLDFEKGVLAFD